MHGRTQVELNYILLIIVPEVNQTTQYHRHCPTASAYPWNCTTDVPCCLFARHHLACDLACDDRTRHGSRGSDSTVLSKTDYISQIGNVNVIADTFESM